MSGVARRVRAGTLVPAVALPALLAACLVISDSEAPEVEVPSDLRLREQWSSRGDVKAVPAEALLGQQRPPGLPFFLPGAGTVASQLVSPAFRAPADLALYVIGYPLRPGNRIALVSPGSERALVLPVAVNPGRSWTLKRFAIPDDWIGEDVRLVATIDGRAKRSAFGISAPFQFSRRLALHRVAVELASLGLAFGLLLGSGLALGYALLRALRLPEVCLTAACLCAMLLLAWAAFWVSFADVSAGEWFTGAAYAAAFAALAWLWLASDPFRRLTRRVLCADAGLMLSVALFYFSLLLWLDAQPFAQSFDRFSAGLGMDAALPFDFARALREDTLLRGCGPWHCSDRPPLQSAVAMFFPALVAVKPTLTLYQATGVVLQATWVPAVLLLMRAIGLPSRTRALTLLFCVFSGFFLLHTLYVWPKLLAAGLAIVALSLPLLYASEGRRLDAGACAFVGGVAALSLLAHGGSLFVLAPGALFLLAPRHYPGSRNVGILALAFLSLYAGWVAFQKLYDPPGDALLRIHLAAARGARGLEKPPLVGLIVDHYAQLSWREWLDAKRASLATLLAAGPATLVDAARAWLRTGSLGALADYRNRGFSSLSPALGMPQLGLALALPLWLARRERSRHLDATLGLIGLALAACGLWFLVIYAHHEVHIASFGAITLLLVGGSVFLCQLPRALLALVLVAHLTLFAVVDVLPLGDRQGNQVPISGEALNPFALALSLVCLAAVALQLVRLARADAAR